MARASLHGSTPNKQFASSRKTREITASSKSHWSARQHKQSTANTIQPSQRSQKPRGETRSDQTSSAQHTQTMMLKQLLAMMSVSTAALAPAFPAAPPKSPRGLENQYWSWRGQTIRYQVAEPSKPNGQSALLVHGLFVNADHWRKTLAALSEAGVKRRRTSARASRKKSQ